MNISSIYCYKAQCIATRTGFQVLEEHVEPLEHTLRQSHGLQEYLTHNKRTPLGPYSSTMPRAVWWTVCVGVGDWWVGFRVEENVGDEVFTHTGVLHL